ncbi:carbohydrate kinase family protein [Patescibacteria group bacterium]
MKTAKILVAGSNVIDLIFQGEVFDKRKVKDRLSLAIGGKYVPTNFYQLFGGGGGNSSISLTNQDFDVMLWSHVGNDGFGRQIVRNLKKSKVKTNLVKFKASATPVSTILLTTKGERTIITYRSDSDLLDLSNSVLREMKKRDWFVLYSLTKCPKKDKLAILKEAKKNNLKVFLSLHGSEYFKGYDYLKDYFKYCDIMHLNAHELADIFGGNAPDFNFKKTNFASKLKLPLLLVTHDIHGSYAYTAQKIYYHPIIKEKHKVDTTGAGDAYSSGFLGEYIKTDSIEKAMYFATKNATSVIEQLGAQNGLIKRS